MNLDDAKKIVKLHLQPKRYNHTLRVVDTARNLALQFNGPMDEVELAAMLHDYAKNRKKEELKRWILNTRLPKDLLHHHHELWHGPVGSLLIERELGITNKHIQSAVHYHTTGKANMNLIEQIVFLADYIEPARNFPGVDEVRKAAESDLVHAIWLAIRNTMMYLIQRNEQIYSDTLQAYNDLTKQMNHNN